MTSILLRNATLVTHTTPTKPGQDYGIKILRNHSLLIENDRITKIAESIEPVSKETTIVDCKDKLITPGFVDTHHHVWQTQLKGRHANEMLLDYLYTGNLQSSSFTAGDIFWGQLGGCLEALDAGTTTLVDHAHCTQTPAHANAALHATLASGIRSFFCYTPTFRVAKFNPFEMNSDLLPDWAMKQLEELCKSQPIGDDRVKIGFACDYLFLPKEMLVPLFEKVKDWGAKLLTTHCTHPNHPVVQSPSPVAKLTEYGILSPSLPTIFSHANSLPQSDIPLLQSANAHISSTPDTELQMGLGTPVCFSTPETHHQSSLGIDCHSNNGASIATQMRLALQSHRGTVNEKLLSEGKNPARIANATVEKAFNLGTILGAKAVGMEQEIGSLEVGKKADVLVWDMLSPGMVCAVEHDPVAAIVMHSCPRDIEMVIVDGEVRKEKGGLKPARKVDPQFAGLVSGEEEVDVAWDTVAKNLLESRKKIQSRIGKIDFEEVREGYMKTLGMDRERFVDGY